MRGAPSTHYEATIDLAQNAPGAHPIAKLRTKLATLGSAIDSRRLALDVWLDRAGRARRVVVSIPLARTGSAMLRVQGDFYAFGTPVRVAVPPQSQVRPYSSLRMGTAQG